MRTRMSFERAWTVLCAVVVLLGLTPMVATSPAHAATIVSPGDANIHYYGRWDTSSGTAYTSYWGAYFKVGFTGTTVELNLAAPVTISVSIDNGPEVSFHNASGTVSLTPQPLASAPHSLRVSSQSTEGDSIGLEGLVLDAGATTTAPKVSTSIVEFAGDSITSGIHNSQEELSDYAWLTGERLGVEHTDIAYSGVCLVDGITCYNSNNSIGMSKQYFKLQSIRYPNSPDWNFGVYPADVVVINLGTNDSGKGVSSSTFQNTYETFLGNIRSKYLSAEILALGTFGSRFITETQAAVTARQHAGDSRVRFIDTTGWLNSSTDFIDGIHPTDAGMVKITNQLAPIVAAYLPYQASSSFGATQGQGGWTYDFSTNNESSFSPMGYDAANARWTAGLSGSDAYCLIGSNWQHPGLTCDSVRVWSAPRTGTVTIGASGPISVAPGCGGAGVQVRVYLGGSGNIWPSSGWYPLANGSSLTFPAGVTATIGAGWNVEFVVRHAGSNNYCDSTTWDPTVTYN